MRLERLVFMLIMISVNCISGFSTKVGEKAARETIKFLERPATKIITCRKPHYEAFYEDKNVRVLNRDIQIASAAIIAVSLSFLLLLKIKPKKDRHKYNPKPLLLAAQNGNNDLVIKLAEKTPLWYAVDETGNNALHYAAYGGQNHTIDLLIKEYGFGKYTENMYGLDVLFIAAYRGYEHTIDHLIKNHHFDIERKNKNYEDVLMFLERMKKQSLAGRLKEKYLPDTE